MTEEPKRRILIIEDETFLASALGDVLRGKGYEVRIALDGEQGLAFVQEKPDLVLLDLMLPKVPGFEILEKIRGNPLTRDIPVFLLTNLESPSDQDRALKLNAQAYYVKANIDLPVLEEKIREYFRNPH